MRSVGRALALVLAGFCLLAPTRVRREPAPDLDKFWKTFRRAVQKRDQKFINQVVMFPIENRLRSADDQPVPPWKKKDFWLYWDGFLARVEWRRDLGPEPEAVSRRALIERWETLPENIRRQADLTRGFRAADLHFRLIRGQWRLYRLYRGDE